MNINRKYQHGFTLIEVLISMVIAALLLSSLTGILSNIGTIKTNTTARNQLLYNARFAMQRMVMAVRGTNYLFIPLAEVASTAYSESVRDVLAVTLDHSLDRDLDGFSDANNDKDFYDRNGNKNFDPEDDEWEWIDEDPSADITNDKVMGILGVDTDGDGEINETAGIGTLDQDDDEDGLINEDPVNGVDDDGDGNIDEDPSADLDDNATSGKLGIDDNLDGLIDNKNKVDDDEDGKMDEDWLDPVVFYLAGTVLMERTPDVDAKDGTDFTEVMIAEDVSSFRVERIASGSPDKTLVDITLVLSGNGTIEDVSVHRRIRVGSGY